MSTPATPTSQHPSLNGPPSVEGPPPPPPPSAPPPPPPPPPTSLPPTHSPAFNTLELERILELNSASGESG